MRILLIAHEFPPIPSAQSLRWAYLVRELSAQGHEIHVLAPDHPGYGPAGGLPGIPDTVSVHRTPGGLFAWLLKRLEARRNRRPRHSALAKGSTVPSMVPAAAVADAPVRLNWKGRLFQCARASYATWMFPDVRAEWTPWARRALRPLLDGFRPDVVIVSHEPASTLPLGFFAKRLGYRLVVDLGDPVCAPYTPRRWRRRALRLEGAACSRADLVTVTTRATRELLLRRHGAEPGRFHVMTQGFDDAPDRSDQRPVGVMDPDRLELLYTGSFYAFRCHRALVQAVVATPGVRLNIASSAVPDRIMEVAQRHPDAVRLLGFLPHADVLALQRAADVLVNLANEDPAQVPGKIYEYLGARRPILHIGADDGDEAVELLRRTGAGRSCPGDGHEIARVLGEARRSLDTTLWGVRNEGIIAQYSWSSHARTLVERIGAQAPRSERTLMKEPTGHA